MHSLQTPCLTQKKWFLNTGLDCKEKFKPHLQHSATLDSLLSHCRIGSVSTAHFTPCTAVSPLAKWRCRTSSFTADSVPSTDGPGTRTVGQAPEHIPQLEATCKSPQADRLPQIPMYLASY